MQNLKKIGLLVADEGEYAPFAALAENGTHRSCSCFGKPGVSFRLESGGNSAEINCVICGIGKVNAAAAAAHLIDGGCSPLLSFGLSGGIDGVRRGELVLADRYLEHDFDLTMIGYKPCEKPGQKYIYDADPQLLRIFRGAIPGVKTGTAVCGDRFICDEKDRLFLRDTFGAVSCDMETAAEAAVCEMAGVPYLALRRISDGADDDAEQSYREMNSGGETLLTDAFFGALQALIASPEFR